MSPIELVDLALHVLGAAVIVWHVAWLGRRGRLGDPLADAATPPDGPGWISLLVVVGTFGVAGLLIDFLILLAFGGRTAEEPLGGPLTHFSIAGGHLAKLVACVPLVVILRTRGCWRPGVSPWRGGVAWWAGLAALSALAIMTLTTLQHQMILNFVRAVWPEARPPQHLVLVALGNDPWPPWGAVHLVVQAVLIAPLVEELFFRGLLLDSLLRLTGRRWATVALTAAVFGAVHVSVPQTILPLVTMGLVLGYLRIRTGSLLLCIVVHVLFNLRTMLMAVLDPSLVAS